MGVAEFPLVLVAGALVPFLVLRAYSKRIEARDADRVDKLHSLNRASGLVTTISMIATMPWFISFVSRTGPPRGDASRELLFGGGIFAVMLAISGGAIAGTFRLYKDLRELDVTPGRSFGKGLRAMLFFFAPLAFLFVTFALLPESVEDNPLAEWALRLAAFLVLFATTPLWIGRAFGRADIDPEVKRELLEFCASHGFRPRDIKAIEGREGKMANAMFVGILPRHRYIFITDYLIDTFSRQELKAVVAHELGHAREHHLIRFLAAFFGAGFVGVAGQLLLAGFDGPVVTVVGVVVMVGSIAFMWWAAWLLWLRFEYRADAFGARIVGVETMVAALEKLAEVNMTPRRTGRLWNVLSRHPSVEQRVERLRAGTTDTAGDSAEMKRAPVRDVA